MRPAGSDLVGGPIAFWSNGIFGTQLRVLEKRDERLR
jgi:hypothetical protein